MYFLQYIFWIYILFFFLSSVLIRENFDNCDNLVYQVGENQKNFKKGNNVNQMLGYTPNTHLYRILEFESSPLPAMRIF